MNWQFLYDDQVYNVILNNYEKQGEYAVNLDSDQYRINAHWISSNCLSLLVDNHSYRVFLAEEGEKLYISVLGEVYCLKSPDNEDDRITKPEKLISGTKKELTVRAPMPGSLIRIAVKKGQLVKENQCLVIIEAMKMETSLCAPIMGKVKKIYVIENQQVNTGDILIELEEITYERTN